MGAQVTVCGPPTLIPRDAESLGCTVAYDTEEIGEADVIYALRMQNERMEEAFVPSLREYASHYQISARRLEPRQLVMHPGPVNRGVELSAEVIDSSQALIADQVASGLVVRMAILYDLLSGGGGDGRRGGAPVPPVEQPA
jgi:aspartate carbamoyltransferase catalytic subunit